MERIQTKFAWALVVALSLLVVAALAGVVRGGPLDPPGPPGSTQENLIYQPANCAGFPITITQPGAYKLAQNIYMPAGCAKAGMAVNSFNVTLDLQGFELVGVTGALSGINATGSNLTVRNGTIRDWPANAILGLWGSVIDDVRATRNGTNGIGLGDRSRVTNCLVEDSGSGYGISVGHDSVVEDCTIRGSGLNELIAGDRALIEDCTAIGDTTAGAFTFGHGIVLGTGGSLSRCTASMNFGDGIVVGPDSLIEDCVAVDNGADGITLGGGSVARRCTSSNNGNEGMANVINHVGILIEDCVVSDNSGGGIQIQGHSTVRDCMVTGNGLPGIDAFGPNIRIEGNQVSGNVAGILLDSGNGSVALMNKSSGNTSYDCRVQLTTTYDFVMIASATGATNPWANICVDN